MLRRVRDLVAVLVAALGAAVLGFALAPLGMNAVIGLVAVIVGGVIVHALRDQLAAPWSDALARIRPRPSAAPRRPTIIGRIVTGVVVTVGSGISAWLLATQGTKALLGIVALVAGGIGLWLLFPLVTDLLRTEPEEPRRRPGDAAVALPPARHNPVTRMVGALVTVVGSAVLAWVLAQLGMKGLVAMVGAVVAASVLVYARDKTVCFTFAAVASLTFVLHKSLSSQDLTMSGGAISLYITTFDVMLLVLYALWVWEGTFVADLRVAWHRRIVWLPLLGAVFLVPSIVISPSASHGAAELFRMGWMFLLFFYLAVRVRTRRHVWAVLGGLSVLACIELVVVVLQAKTGGVLGLSFLGVPTQLGERVTDAGSVGRPFGTIIHPVFMGAVMGSLALVALAFAIELRRSLTKLAATVLVPICLAPMYLAHTRASLVAFGLAALCVIAAGLARGRLQWRTIGRAMLLLLVLVAVLFPQVSDKISENFGTAHFTEEVDSRRELNDLAGQMIDDHPVVGVGLNNFELVLPRYERYRVIFFNNPVHNLYLLYLSETGIVGLFGVVLVGVAMFNVALRLGRSREPLLGAVGIGVSGAMGFLMIEELLGFSLRQDTPLALYWMLAGLAVACYRIAGFEGHRAFSSRSKRGLPEALAARAAQTEPVPARTGRPALLRAGSRPRLRLGRRMRLGVLTAVLFGGAAVPLAVPAGATTTTTGPTTTTVPSTTTTTVATTSSTGTTTTTVATTPTTGTSLPTPVAVATNGLRVTFTATERSTGIQGIYVTDTKGTAPRRITPPDGRFYNWSQWAFGGTKLVYTVRAGPEGSPEDLGMMNPDGSGARILQKFEYRIGQPKVDPSGRFLVFTAQAPWFPHVAIYRMDLRTLESTNISALSRVVGAIDADPMFLPDGRTLAIASSDLVHTQIHLLSLDGATRTAVTHDPYYNTDPDVSPDGRTVAISSYRGEGSPGEPGRISLAGIRPFDWHLVLRDLRTGAERVVTEGKNCVVRAPIAPCTVRETSAFKPRWSPDGTMVAFNGAISSTQTCICIMGADGRPGTPVIVSTDLALDWFDWVQPSPRPGGTDHIGTAQRSSAILLTQSEGDGPASLVAASPDLMHRLPLSLPAGLAPEEARWTSDHRTVVFTARVPLPSSAAEPHPAPPAGQRRREHVTLPEIDPARFGVLGGLSPTDPAQAGLQLFLRDEHGNVRQLTDPWIEDWRDGVRLGDARANHSPVLSNDGRWLAFTNTSTLTGESFLLRLDLRSGEVVNLTSATSGALPVHDAHAAFSPDGSRLVFTWANGGTPDLFVMDNEGGQVRAITRDDWEDATPTWLPDGRSVVFASRRVPAPARTDGPDPFGWVLMRVDIETGAQQQLTELGASPVFRPAVAPEGDRVIYVGIGPRTGDVFVLPPDGSAPPAQLQPDTNLHQRSLDWK